MPSESMCVNSKEVAFLSICESEGCTQESGSQAGTSCLKIRIGAVPPLTEPEMSMRERIKSSLAHASGSVRCHFGTFETASGNLSY